MERTGRRKTVNKENVLKLTKMGYIASKKYCRKKYRKEVRKHMKGMRAGIFCKYRSSCDNMFDFRG